MKPIPLFTSLPPGLIRRNPNGCDIGKDYQEKCIQSWRRQGFDIYSVNSEKERIPSSFPSHVTFKRTTGDAFQETGKHLPYLTDLLNVISNNVFEGPFVITNSDIILDANAIDEVSNLKPGECVIEKRYDITDTSNLEAGSFYDHGYDFFAFNIKDISKLKLDGMVVGVPWWDHLLPLRALFCELKRKKVDRPLAYHLKHDERWDERLWIDYGYKFIDTVQPLSDVGGQGDYLKLLKSNVLNKPTYVGMNRMTIKNLLEKAGILVRSPLHRLSSLNVKTIDEWT